MEALSKSQPNIMSEPKSQGSVYKGVYRCGKKFKAQIQIERVQHYLGLYDSEIEAAIAYDNHARIILGSKARTNFAFDATQGVIQPASSRDDKRPAIIITNVSESAPTTKKKRGYAGLNSRIQWDSPIDLNNELASNKIPRMDTGLNLSSASGSRSNSIPSGSTSPGLGYSYPEDKASSPLHQLACVAEAAAENHGPGLKQQNNHCHNLPAHPLAGYSHLPNLNTAPPLDAFAAELAYQQYLNFLHSNALYGYQDSTLILPPSTHQLQPFRHHVVPPSLQANNERFFRPQAEGSKSSVYTRPQLPAGSSYTPPSVLSGGDVNSVVVPPLPLSPRKNISATGFVNQTVPEPEEKRSSSLLSTYWAGVLFIDPTRRKQVWKGSYVDYPDHTVTPDPVQFACSTNYFEYVTECCEVASGAVLSAMEVRLPHSGMFQGKYHATAGEDGSKQVCTDIDFSVQFTAVGDARQPKLFKATGQGKSSVHGAFTVNGAYSPLSGVLELQRDYVAKY